MPTRNPAIKYSTAFPVHDAAVASFHALAIKVAFIAACALFSFAVIAHDNPGYSHDEEARTSHPDWLTALRDDVKLSELSLPGTHDTMSFYGGDIVQTQSMPLPNQLQSGVRVLDIRCRHIADVFAIHHGVVFQNVFFGDVLNMAVAFLDKHPGEVIFMHVQEEYTPENNTETFQETFYKHYWLPYQNHFWSPTLDASNNPSIGELRGKIVILQNFAAGTRFGIDGDHFDTQNDWLLNTNWDLYSKWTKVKNHLKVANDGASDTLYMNYLSGSTGSFPYFVASGHSSPQTGAPRLLTGQTEPGWKDSYPDFPRVSCIAGGVCSIAFEGTNVLTYERLGVGYKTRVGSIMADFPGPGLIDRLVALNDRFKRNGKRSK